MDRLRLVYLCVIASLLLAMDEKVAISHIKLVMDCGMLRTYPWGLEAFDHLLDSIKNAREKLMRKTFWIWIMKDIPDFGDMLGQKHKGNNIVVPGCSN